MSVSWYGRMVGRARCRPFPHLCAAVLVFRRMRLCHNVCEPPFIPANPIGPDRENRGPTARGYWPQSGQHGLMVWNSGQPGHRRMGANLALPEIRIALGEVRAGWSCAPPPTPGNAHRSAG